MKGDKIIQYTTTEVDEYLLNFYSLKQDDITRSEASLFFKLKEEFNKSKAPLQFSITDFDCIRVVRNILQFRHIDCTLASIFEIYTSAVTPEKTSLRIATDTLNKILSIAA